MGKTIAIQIGTAIIAIVISSVASAQMDFVKRACPMGDDPVMVEVRPVPNRKARYCGGSSFNGFLAIASFNLILNFLCKGRLRRVHFPGLAQFL